MYEGPEVGWDEGTSGESMRDQRLGGMRVQVEGESMRDQRLGGMRVQVERESMRAQRLGGMRVQVARVYEGAKVGVG